MQSMFLQDLAVSWPFLASSFRVSSLLCTGIFAQLRPRMCEHRGWRSLLQAAGEPSTARTHIPQHFVPVPLVINI